MKFGLCTTPQDIDYNQLKKLCGTEQFFPSFVHAINSWEGTSSNVERNFLGGLKLLKKHQKKLIHRSESVPEINIETLFNSNSVFSKNYQQLATKFSRKYPEFFLIKHQTFEIIAHRAFEPYLQNLSNNWKLRQTTDCVEIDVNICKTGEVILQHDRYHHNGQPLENVEFSQLQNPVTFRDLISKWYQIRQTDNKPKLMIDVKGWNQSNIIKNIHQLLTEFHINKKDILIASFNQNYVIQSKKLGYHTAFITANHAEYHFLHFMKHNQIDHIILDENNACKNAVDVYHQNSINVWVYTVNKKGRFNYLIDIGVDGIITDYPNLIIDLNK